MSATTCATADRPRAAVNSPTNEAGEDTMVDSSTGLTRDQAQRLRETFDGRHRHAGGRHLRRRPPAVERDPRPPAGGHRPARVARGCRDRDPLRPRQRLCHSPSAPVATARRAIRSATAASSSTWRGCAACRWIRRRAREGERRHAPRRARRRGPGARARLPDRRHRPHRRRGADARWRGRAAPAATSG